MKKKSKKRKRTLKKQKGEESLKKSIKMLRINYYKERPKEKIIKKMKIKQKIQK